MNPSFQGGALSAPDVDFDALLKRLLASPRLTIAERRKIDKAQGVYAWWLIASPETCLKVGRAFLGSRKDGLFRRIRHHFSSNEDTSVLACHLAADTTSPWCVGADLHDRPARRSFLATQCCVQVLPLPDLTERQVEQLEDYLEAKLKPRYIGKVGGDGCR